MKITYECKLCGFRSQNKDEVQRCEAQGVKSKFSVGEEVEYALDNEKKQWGRAIVDAILLKERTHEIFCYVIKPKHEIAFTIPWPTASSPTHHNFIVWARQVDEEELRPLSVEQGEVREMQGRDQPPVNEAESKSQGHVEKVWLDLLYKGNVSSFYSKGGIAEKLTEALERVNPLLVELNARLAVESQRSKAIHLGDLELARVNITVIFRSEMPLGQLFGNIIWPFVFNYYLRHLLNSENCTILEDIHPGEYFQAMSAEASNIAEGVMRTLAKEYPDVPPEFARAILGARPSQAP